MLKLGIPDPTQANKSKIIFTTRSEEVCDQMLPHQKVKVDCLGWDDAWILFKKNAGEMTLDSNPRIRHLAMKVAKKCDRLPLALKVVGRAMAGKRTPQQWENALTTLRKSPSQISGTEEELFSRLKLSYDALPNPAIRECFLYCCLFPEDWLLDKEKLVDYWVAEGFLGIDETLTEARNRGHDYISTLTTSFLLEEDYLGLETEVKMHDVIRDMAIWIVSEHGKDKSKFFVHPSPRLSKSQTADRWREANRIFVWDSKELPQVTNKSRIRTLIWRSSSVQISFDGLFNAMPLLRVLDTDIEELPAAIGHLVELRYLCLYGKQLQRSWLGNLAKLEILDLSKTLIEELPDTIGQLVELRHLNLEGCKHLKALPAEVGNCCKLEMLNLKRTRHLGKLPAIIGKLAELRYLDLSETNIKMLPEEFWELKNLEHLYFLGDHTMRFTAVELCKFAALQSLKHLEICANEFSGLRRLSNCLTKLWTKYCPSTTRSMELLPLFGNIDRLSELWIRKSAVEKIVASAVSNMDTHNTSFSSIETLCVRECAHLSGIVLDKLSLVSLRFLDIRKCDRLRQITGLQHLQWLEKLLIGYCDEIEEAISSKEEGTEGFICFPGLKVLEITSLYKLKSICRDTVSFPSLEAFYLNGCPRLEQLPLGLMNGNRTVREGKIWGSRKWWNGLKWQDDNFKSFILPYFKVRKMFYDHPL